ncbi:hypothetical protein ABZ671_01100 [Micromonospora sp. NPDC006766]|uniref:hypothetical protein n=1 Tax=Micromonospora sp. NPDC006766 TaxID=3154778 RepID=UPI0033CBF1B6
MTSNDLNWATPGTRVAVLHTDAGRGTGVELRTVKHATATQVVLDNDTRWRVRDGKQLGKTSDTWSTVGARVRRVDDPEVVATRAGIRLRNLGRTIGTTLTGKRTQVTDVDAALALLAEVEQAIAATRKRIEALR